MKRETLVNIALFLERVPVTGKEALAWSETYTAVVAEINAIDAAAKAERDLIDATARAASTAAGAP